MYMTKSPPCQSNFGSNYSSCNLRCWGYGHGGESTAVSGLNNTPGDATIVEGESTGIWPNARNDYLNGVNSTPWTKPAPTQSWSYPKHDVDQLAENPLVVRAGKAKLQPTLQGFSFTLAGDVDGLPGFRDGQGLHAR